MTGMNKCSVGGCDRKYYGRGFCSLHYKRNRRHGDPLKTVKRKDGEGTIRPDGYKVIYIDWTPHREHRLVWERANGPIPKGMHIHHINGDPLDNRIENLQLVEPRAHQHIHFKGKKRAPFSAQAIANISAAQKARFAKAKDLPCQIEGCEEKQYGFKYCQPHLLQIKAGAILPLKKE